MTACRHALCFAVLSLGLQAFAALNYPLHAQVITFPENYLMQSTQTHLEYDGSAKRTRTLHVEAYVLRGTCENILGDFQKRILGQYESERYIDKATRIYLEQLVGTGIEPRQLVLLQLTSDITEAEFERVKHLIPEERWFRKYVDPKTQKPMQQILRGTVMAIRGFGLQGSGQSYRIENLQMPWELKPLPNGMAKPINREKVKFNVEIGRVMMEKGELPGDLGYAIKLMATFLNNEFSVLKVQPENVLITAHGLDPEHLRLFTARLPMRLLTQDVQERLEADPQTTLQNVLAIPRPRGQEWANINDGVVFTPLSQFVPALSDFSWAGLSIPFLSDNIVKEADALKLVREYATAQREDFNYVDDQHSSRHPIMIKDFLTPFYLTKMLSVWRRFGLDLHSPKGIAVFDFIRNHYSNGDADLNMGHRVERWDIFPYPIEALSGYAGNGITAGRNLLVVSNIDPKQAQLKPESYLAGLILSVADLYRNRIEEMGPRNFQDLIDSFNHHPTHKPPAPVPTISFAQIVDQFPLGFASSSPEVQQQLLSLGAQAIPATAYNFDQVNIICDANGKPQQMAIPPRATQIFVFHAKQIEQIRQYVDQKFPQLTNNARQRLHKSFYPERLRLLQCGLL